jgi:hypothetical protein
MNKQQLAGNSWQDVTHPVAEQQTMSERVTNRKGYARYLDRCSLCQPNGTPDKILLVEEQQPEFGCRE